ncbi:MAG: glycogen synthase GlgA [Oscillatoriaceae bacterium SKW80]|nr:glycogen synthase GlgA [Oscillatoriaceae bacterium SKYG93]MCX8120154.1 glycogen synthase GlgA [Oscillatoriaceae bacterium SKW80]MDW8453080.1 glycogen synthase GlgA [Oscillatoriaceae cyanobacterium SKYGB_i_bin93]HIK29009.1 glycogen synthase GlgA [Oscillatoriaceae cyanobacterium M7585_C2015_266]
MYIVQIASECAPVIKAGGLGDVVYGLSRELEIQQHCVEIILPKYDCMRYDQIWGLHDAYRDLWVPWYGGAIHCSVFCGWVHGRLCFFIEPHSEDNFFNRGCYYGCKDDNMRFAFFSKAALEFLLQSNKRPDVIHCHDWQTGLVPVLLFEIYKYHGMWNQRVCYTIHNFKHQGLAGVEVLWGTGLNRESYYFDYDRLRDNFNPFALNLMKGGIVYSNFVTTVSPHHAWEAHHSDMGYGLGHTLHLHQHKFKGILNGIDYEVWNPEIDRFIPYHYNKDSFTEKEKNKKALRERLWLRHADKPIVCYVGRLDDQKGVHLVHYAIYYSLLRGAQFVLLGSATEDGINSWFWHEKQYLNDNPDAHLELGFNEELSHLIYAGADIIVVPSNYEPCGLTQMIGMRYGTVPVVRGIGGLVSTVFDWDYDTIHPPEKRNGFVFFQTDHRALESALDRALDLWYEKREIFNKLAIQGMEYDYSWYNPACEYLKVYDFIRHK